MLSKMITSILVWLLAASLGRTHEDVDVPRTQIYGVLPPSAQLLPGPPSGLYPGIKPIGGCPYPPVHVSAGHVIQGPNGYGNHPHNGGFIGEVIVPINHQYSSPYYYSQPGGAQYKPQYINGPNIQYGTNIQHTGGPYYLPPCVKPLLETSVEDKSRAVSPQNEFSLRKGDEQGKNPTENLLGGLYLAPYKSNCDSGRSSENEETVPLQFYETRSVDSPTLTATNPHFAQGLNNYFHRFGFTKPLPHGGLIYSNTFSNHLHSNLH